MKLNIHIIKSNYFTNINKFSKYVFNNFIHLVNNHETEHNIPSINKLLGSKYFHGYIVKYENKIIAYLLGEIKYLDDGRTVYFINYIYVIPKFRSKGIASKLMKIVINNAQKNNFDNVMLVYDTYNTKLKYFYTKMGFERDMILKRFTRHDIFSLKI